MPDVIDKFDFYQPSGNHSKNERIKIISERRKIRRFFLSKVSYKKQEVFA
jgi:hypothetical protein